MKRIITFAFALILVFALSFNALAEEIPTETPDINEEITVTEAEEKGIIDTLMNSTVWISIGSYVSLAFGIVIFVHKKFGTIAQMIRNKAEVNDIKGAIKETVAELKTQLEETQLKLATAQENEKKLTTILCMYIMNDTKYNPNAKAEIMKYISGIKDFSGTVLEICNEATAEIQKMNDAEEKEQTPTLDEIVSEANTLSMALN